MLQLLKPECPTVCAPEEEKPLQWEACALQQRTVPLTTTRESLHTERKTQHNRKLKTILKVKKKDLKKKKKISSQNNCHTQQKKLLVYKGRKQNKMPPEATIAVNGLTYAGASTLKSTE